MEDNFVKDIEKRIQKRNLKITSVPIPVIKEFKKFCEEECGDVYSVGLYQLLKAKKQYESLVPLLSSTLQELNEIKSQVDTKKNERGIKTFDGIKY